MAEDRAQRQQRVMEAAAELFAFKGVDGVSMREIGKACELHMSTLYHYYDSKEALYSAVCEWTNRAASEIMLKALHTEGSPEERIHGLVKTLVRYFLSDSPQILILDRQSIVAKAALRSRVPAPAPVPEHNQLLEKVIQEFNPPILAFLSAYRISEILWDVTWGMTRFLPAHIIMGRPADAEPDENKIFHEVWLVIDRMLQCPSR